MEPDGLTAEIERAMGELWLDLKHMSLPDMGAEDRRLLFAAVSLGLLRYLHQHENTFFKSMTMEAEGFTSLVYTVSAADMNIGGIE